MKLHENKEIFQDAILAASQLFGIPEIYIEKDYWVTIALQEIFNSSASEYAVFKGGTSLSKCYNIIERFSEDIDIVVFCKEEETDNQKKAKIKRISGIVKNIMPEVEIEGLTNKKGNIRKTAHKYNKLFNSAVNQIGEYVVLEVSWLGNSEPFIKSSVSSYINEMAREKGLKDLIKKYDLEPFYVQVLEIERTFCEKILSLVRFSYTDNPYEDLANKVRHLYDIHLMLKDTKIKDFFNGAEFDNMLLKVGEDDLKSYKNSNEWLNWHPSEAIIFSNPEDTWKRIRSKYNSSFKDLVIGKLPAEDGIMNTLKIVAERLKSIKWQLKIR